MSRETGQSRRKQVIIIAIIVLVIIAGLVAYLIWHKGRQSAQVQTSTVRLQTMKRVTISSGDVRPIKRQLIYANSLTVPIRKLDVQVGSHVKQGQQLIQLDTTTTQIAVTQAKATLAQANKAYSQALASYQAAPTALQAILLPQVDTTQSAVVQAKQQLSAAESQLAALSITANFAGSVIIASADGVDASGNQSPIIELVGSAKQVVLELSEIDAIHVKKGMKVTMTTQALPNQTFKGVVSQVAPFAATSQSGTPQVQVLVQASGAFAVPLGYQMNCKITSSTHKSVPTVPYNALVQQGTNYAVYTLDHGHVHLTTVQLGITNNESVEVTSGLTSGQTIVDNPPSTLVNGEAVTVQ